MRKNNKSISNTGPLLFETEGARRATGVSNNNPNQNNIPDPEVSTKATRRRFTAQYKLRILQDADNCTSFGQVGALLRREGLYASNLTTWRRQKERGSLDALSPKRRGPKKKESDSLTRHILVLERENSAIKQKLKQAETIIAVQKKISEILNIPSNQTGEKI
jgi:transposase-like protein